MSQALMNIQFDQSPSGRWFYVSAEGVRHDHVMAVRSFPVAAPEEGIALVDAADLAMVTAVADVESAVAALP